MTPETTSEPPDRAAAGDDRARRVLLDALAYARERDYTGWDYGDGLSSRIRRWLPFESRWTNLLFQESVKRAPVNVRPLLLVEQRRNYKGAALFAMANLNVAALATGAGGGRHPRRDGSERGGPTAGASSRSPRAAPPSRDGSDRGGTSARRSSSPSREVGAERVAADVDCEAEARDLVEWLIEHRCPGYSGFCGGHRHEIQHLHSKGEPSDADVVSTSYAVRALLAAARLDPSYAAVARTAADFVVEDLDYREVEGGAKIDYYLDHPDGSYTLNAGALGARLFVDLYDYFGDERLLERARKILDYLVGKQTDPGGWYYRDPPSASHLSMDNHHNGFVVESFLRYREVTGDGRYDATLRDALAFYRHTLFDPDGAPNWDESRAFPRDVHASAQGILVFTYAGDRAFARRILEWTLDTLYAGDGRFYYREHRLFTKRITLMRWCQAWMAYAISEFLTARRGQILA